MENGEEAEELGLGWAFERRERIKVVSKEIKNNKNTWLGGFRFYFFTFYFFFLLG